MIYQDRSEKYRYGIRFDVENYDYLCRISNRLDVSIAYLINYLVKQARKRDTPFQDPLASDVTTSSCQTNR